MLFFSCIFILLECKISFIVSIHVDYFKDFSSTRKGRIFKNIDLYEDDDGDDDDGDEYDDDDDDDNKDSIPH